MLLSWWYHLHVFPMSLFTYRMFLSGVFCCCCCCHWACPNLFEVCYWYQIQNKHMCKNNNNNQVDDVKHWIYCLCWSQLTVFLFFFYSISTLLQLSLYKFVCVSLYLKILYIKYCCQCGFFFPPSFDSICSNEEKQ